MSNVVVTLAVANQDFPVGTAFGEHRVTLTGAAGEVSKSGPEVEFTFADVLPGDYDVSAISLDPNGVALSGPFTVSITVLPSTVSLSVVVGVSAVAG